MVHWRRKRQTTPVFLSEEPHGHYEKTKRYDTGRRASRLEGVQYVTREEQRAITNSSRKNKASWPKHKLCSVMDVSGGESKVQCCKKQYCIGTWNVRSMNQGKLEVVQQESRVKINILGISELKWMGMGEFNSDDH